MKTHVPNVGKNAVSRTVAIIAVVVVVVLVVAGASLALLSSTSTTSSTSSTSSTSTTPTSSTTATSSTSSSSSSTSASSSEVQILTIDDWQYPSPDLNQLDPGGFSPAWTLYSTYQTLTYVNQSAEYSPGVLNVIPGLAQGWTESPNGTVFTFNLRQDVHFSNGDPFNAYEVWMNVYDAGYYLYGNASNWFQGVNIFDYSNVNFGPATEKQINSSGTLSNPGSQALAIMENSAWPIFVTGQYQIVFRLVYPYSYFPGMWVVFNGQMVDMQYVLDHGGVGNSSTVNQYFVTNPIPGTGPYIISNQVSGSYATFTQDNNYWGNSLTASELAANPFFDPGHAKTVIINYKADDVARYTDVSDGTAQISAVLGPDFSTVLANPTKYGYVVLPKAANDLTYEISLDLYKAPTNNTDFRLAVVHAINKTQIAQEAFSGFLSSFFGPEIPGFPSYYNLGNYSYNYNLTLARAELHAANISGTPTATFEVYSGCSFCVTTAEVFQSDLAQIGITVTINQVSLGTYFHDNSGGGSWTNNIQRAKTSRANFAIPGGVAWEIATATPGDIWFSLVSNQSLYGNYAAYSNPTVQACVNDFLTQANNPSALQAACGPAQTQIYNDAPYYWVGLEGLIDGSGSLVYQKSVVTGMLLDPFFGADTETPIINTVTFA